MEPEDTDTLDQVRASAAQRILFLAHAVRQMAHPDRIITAAEVQHAVEEGDLIEDYPEDRRGHSCLILGRSSDGTAVHVVCSPKVGFLAIITAYRPGSDEWESDLKTRMNR